jgi:Na+-driven multidrug efflux pump
VENPRVGKLYENDPVQIIEEDSDSSTFASDLPPLTEIKIVKAINEDEMLSVVLNNNNNDTVELSTNILDSVVTRSPQNESEIPFSTPDILSGVDQAKLMDPTEVLKSVIGPAFSDDVESFSDEASLSDSDSSADILESKVLLSPPAAPKADDSLQPAVKTVPPPERAIETPDVQSILKFAVPAIGVWLCGPLLSLIDTSSVGLLSGTAQQAALNPAVAVTDYGALLVAFMYTATTNLVAAAREKESQQDGQSRSAQTLITSLQLSGIVGTVLGGALIVFTKILLRSIIGNDAIDPEVFQAAMKYVRIRALGMPAAVIIGSAQSACLGMQDIRSPLYVLVAAAVVNFLGDCIFVGSSSPIFGGAAGAAWATVFSQYAALGMFIKWLTTKAKKQESPVNLTNAILELTSKSKEGKPRRRKFREALRSFQDDTEHIKIPKAFSPLSNIFKNKQPKAAEAAKPKKQNVSVRGFLAGKFSAFDLFKPPSLERAKEFWPYVIPVTTTSVGRVSSYVAMSHVVSSALGTIGMAAQQVIVSLFYCLTPVADSLNLTAQSFIPAIFEKKKSQSRAVALKKSFANFMKAAAIFGVLMAGAASSIPLFSGFFTSDPIVISQVNAVVPYLAGCFLMHGFITAGEGVLLGQKDLGFLGKLYAAFFVGVPYFMLRVKSAAASGLKSANLTSVWQIFLGYQFVRMGSFIMRLWQLQRRTDRDSALADTSS